MTQLDQGNPESDSNTSEGQQDLDHFEADSPFLFRQKELFSILVSESRMRHRELRKKACSRENLTQETLW